MNTYGKELLVDLHYCDSSTFKRKSIRKYFQLLCEKIDMKPEKLCWWDDHGVEAEMRQTESHTKGTTAVQFILTSNITIHTLDVMKRVYLNIFTCKDFKPEDARDFCQKYFDGKIVTYQIVDRI